MPKMLTDAPEAPAVDTLIEDFRQVRRSTEALCAGLATEDFVVQSMEDVSPTKWHLAHTSWFFETFLLRPHAAGYRPLDDAYGYLFNSYYVQAGERHCRDQRGYISRPTVAEVFEYRHHVDQAIETMLESADEPTRRNLQSLITLGLHHEQQHQELMLTDIKHVFSVNPLRPVFRDREVESTRGSALRWCGFDEGVYWIGHDGDGFAYDNERPRHRRFVEAFEIADRLTTNGEYLEFMADGGYRHPELWLSLGWATLQERAWTEPFYWERRDGEWWLFSLSGMRRVEPNEPVCHLNYFEADAFARWSGARLPSEAEWEVAAHGAPVAGNLVEAAAFHPRPAHAGGDGPRQMFGDVWEWTSSQYEAYPGFEPEPGAIGEYNGKFMCNQFVLRGGSCVTAASHIRPSYRNFFPPDASWQFTGLRLARNA
ncbi:MAG: ergothioneine biosynthesis protein EgtB [Gemmatimonadota bacterium]